MPGLVNAHAHTPLTVLRGMGGDLPLMRWLTEVVWPAEAKLDGADVRAGMLAGSAEMLRGGVTTSAEMYFQSEHVVDAVLEIGSRVVLTPGIITAPGMDRLGTWQQMRDAITRWIDADGLRFGPGERVELGYGPHAAYTLPVEALASVAEHAKARDALVHIHVAESAHEDVAQRAAHGSVPALLDEVGLLDGRLLAAHAVQLSDSDIALLGARGAAVAHCPGSNAKLAAGIARTTALRRAGVRVGLGTDGPASGDDLDLWAEARLAGLLARVSVGDAAALTAAELVLMATRDGAAAIGRTDIGVLEAGRWADLVHIELADSAFVDPDDDAQLLSNLVWAGGSRLVRDVWVAGEQVLADREPTRVDRAAATAKLRASAARLHS
jgi:5-methylthioadenosine/S-adenosylhomocysteine deaminase